MRFVPIAALGSCAVLFSTAILGCSDDPPPPESGGYSVEFAQGDDPANCPIQPHNGDIGTVTATDPNGVVSGDSGSATIDCTITGTSTFSVEGTVSGASNLLHILIPSISKSATVDKPAKGQASFASPNTVGSWHSPSDKPCAFWFDNSKQKVATGEIWVSFSCEEVDNNQSTCALTNGVVILENCATANVQ